MSEIAIIKDVMRNTPHVLLFKDGKNIEAKALTEYGKNILSDIYLSEDTKTIPLPVGFSCSPFKKSHLSENIFKKTDEHKLEYKSLESANQQEVPAGGSFIFSKRVKNGQETNLKNLSVLKLDNFKIIESKLNVIDFKARQFSISRKFSTVISSMKSGEFGFNSSTSQFSSKSSNPLSVYSAEKAESYIGVGPMRRIIGDKSIDSARHSSKRLARRAKSLSPINDSKNKLGIFEKFISAAKSRLR